MRGAAGRLRRRRDAHRGVTLVAMPTPSHERPGRGRAWRVATPLIILASGVLFAVSAEQSDGFDLRGGRLTDLASVVRAERDEAAQLTAQAGSARRVITPQPYGLIRPCAPLQAVV